MFEDDEDVCDGCDYPYDECICDEEDICPECGELWSDCEC